MDDVSFGPEPGRVRQSRLRSRREAAGLVQVSLWVPARLQAEIHDTAQRLRDAAGVWLAREAPTSQLDLFREGQASLPTTEIRP